MYKPDLRAGSIVSWLAMKCVKSMFTYVTHRILWECRDGTVHRWGAFPEVIFGVLMGSHWVGPEKSRVGWVVGRVSPTRGGGFSQC